MLFRSAFFFYRLGKPEKGVKRKKMADSLATALDFAPLWTEVRRRLGHSEAKMSILTREFVRALSVKDPTESGGLPAQLDAVGHEAMLNTRMYSQLCDRICGHFVHHTTASEMDDDVIRQSRIDKTVIAYRKRYREEPPAEVWAEADMRVLTLKRSREESREESEVTLKRSREEAEIFRVLVRQVNGKSVTLEIGPLSTVQQLKEIIHKQTGISSNKQRLIYAGMQLVDNSTCEEIGLRDGDAIYMVERLAGC